MIQTRLFKVTEKDEKIAEISDLLNTFKTDNKLNKIIQYFGNIESDILILGESPVRSHLEHPISKRAFCFDLNCTKVVDNKSGSILINVFNKLHKNIKDYFWTNVYKLPLETLSIDEKHRHEILLTCIINVLEFKKIICLGNTAYDIVTKLRIDCDIKKIWHPGYIIRNPAIYEQYLKQWEKVLK